MAKQRNADDQKRIDERPDLKDVEPGSDADAVPTKGPQVGRTSDRDSKVEKDDKTAE
jgi:hypothetical protein